MKANIHPQYQQANVICACGNRFTVGSTQEVIHVELCSNCHPFYTGAQRFVDTGSRIKNFEDQIKKAQAAQAKMKAKKDEKQARQNAPKTLAEMLAGLK